MDDAPCAMSEPDQCIICLDALPRAVDTGAPTHPTNATGAHHHDHHQHDADAQGSSAHHPSSNGIIVPVFEKAGLVATGFDAGNNSELPDAEGNAAHARVARLHGCDHVLHETCIRSWAEKTNTCPICRTPFLMVSVTDGVSGPEIDSFAVEEKKQVADFDIREWLDQNDNLFEEEEETPCPVCNRSDHEEQLLLCDNCNAAYHTFCIGLNMVPEGHWYCIECVHTMTVPLHREAVAAASADPVGEEAAGDGQSEDSDDEDDEIEGFGREHTPAGAIGSSERQTVYFPRTRSRMRHVRQHARMAVWQGQWGELTGHVFENLDLDLDNPFGEDETLQHFRQSQRRSDRERREYERWQQRLNIASRLGAREVFTRSIPASISEHLVEPPPRRSDQEVRAERTEQQAWGALDKAREDTTATGGSSSTNGRKRQRSRSHSPSGPAEQQAERKLKRPRTRRLPATGQGGAEGPSQQAQQRQQLHHQEQQQQQQQAPTRGHASPPRPPVTAASPIAVAYGAEGGPTFLSSLLREVEMSVPGEDDGQHAIINGSGNGANGRLVIDASPSAGPASPTGYSSPRAMTPPPFSNDRPSSPLLSLSSHIEPRYPPVHYSPTHGGSDEARRTSSPNRRGGIRAASPDGLPRESRRQSVRMEGGSPRMADASPTRPTLLSIEVKSDISNMVRAALRPHWHAKQLSPEQYASINRDISHKLYDAAEDMTHEDGRKKWEHVVSQEVARAVSELQS